MKNKFVLISIFFTLFFTQCSSYKDKVTGTWSILKVKSANNNVGFFDLLSHAILLSNDNTCIVPRYSIYQDADSYTRGTWSIEKKAGVYYLTINTVNKLFNGKYQIEKYEELFNPQVGHKDKIQLRSKELYLECWKQHDE